ncbi:MAG: PEP/pyruvate-binding domain-containing protein [Odoribacter sp.]
MKEPITSSHNLHCLMPIELHKIYKRKKSDRDIFQELMPFKIKEILLIANYYDAYTIEGEGQFTDKIVGEYLQVNLYTAPRFTSVASESEALKLLAERQIDLIIIMAGLDKQTPLLISRHLKTLYPHTCQLMLVNNNADLAYFHTIEKQLSESIERLFVWNGSTKIFLVMAKYIEDKMNLDRDTHLGDIRVILLVENSVRYYSRYLPLLYTEIMAQTQKLILSEPQNNDMSLVMKIRIRPKVILATTFEEAVYIIDHYRENLIGVISDVRYKRKEIEDENAGIELIQYVEQTGALIPCLLQSKEAENADKAKAVGATFINKNSPTLAHDIQSFIKTYLGFGDFIFRNAKGEAIDKVTSIEEFKQKLLSIPDESLIYHSVRNGISTWLMARREITLARYLKRYHFEDFQTPEAVRKFILRAFESSDLRKIKGRIINYNPKLVDSNRYISRLAKGSFGGKGRGMAFLSNFIENVDFKKLIPHLQIQIPKTAIIGVDEFDNFIENNELNPILYNGKSYEEIQTAFIAAKLTEKLRTKLRSYLEVMHQPLAIRSSGLFEDSLNQPFAGVYSTYLIPNNHPQMERRIEELENAIKLVYASIFTDSSRAYFNAIGSMIEEEKMAVIIQEVIGREYRGKYYPNISGVAQSYNFYPFSYIKPEDGFAVIALGLGSYVVGGEKAYRFCPRYPKLQLASIQDMARDSQKYFYAIDMVNKSYQLARDGENAAIQSYDLKTIEDDHNLQHCASVYDFINDRIVFDLKEKGIRIINFPDILQYDSIPLASTLDTLLDIFSQAMGTPVEMEFSINRENEQWIFYILQIKPLIKNEYNIDIDREEIDESKIILRANKGMGNGKINNIRDIIYIDPQKFNRLRTEEMAEEVKYFNEKLKANDTEYILIGPGRWGTRDKLTGIPVLWSDISKARVIVEQGLKDFPLEASLGSHFFHNVTSMNVGYFAVPYESENSFIHFDLLRHQEITEEKEFVRHIRFKQPIAVYMDGKKQTSVIVAGE